MLWSAVAYYNGALEDPHLLENNLSPATAADVEATLVILRSLRTTIPGVSARLDRGYSFFAEELQQKLKSTDEYDAREANIIEMIGSLGEEGAHIKRTAKDFQTSFKHCLGILFDAIDGTTSFRAGIPVFVSAIAFFIEGEPRVGAIYDPHNQLVYCGSLRDSDSGTTQGHVYVWEVQAGNRADLDLAHLQPLEEKSNSSISPGEMGVSRAKQC
jgi:3'-phosphoadenosine 5'-phosphosulfate (PAPS) 3'-phosphatase